MIGRFTTGNMGLGWFAVIGRSRVPSPPAITTAFTAAEPPLLGRPSGHAAPHRPGIGFRQELPRLHDVKARRPPVQGTSPDREHPTDDPRYLGVACCV